MLTPAWCTMPAMAIHPLAQPLSIAARPKRTGGRKIGVLLCHGFTGSPASITPWGEAVAGHGYAIEVPRLPGHGTSWQECNKTTWDDWYAEATRAFEKLAQENEAVVVGGLSMGGALMLRLAADQGERVSGVVLVNPAVNTTRKDVLALPVLKHLVGSFPGIANDIKKPGVEEHGYTRTPLKAAHSMMSHWPSLREDLPRITVPVLYFKSADDHVVDPSSLAIIKARLSTTDFTERTLEQSYHVATLDNDAPLIYQETADFVARVTA